MRAFATEYVSETFCIKLSDSGVKTEEYRLDHVEAALSDEGVTCVLLWQDPIEVVVAGMEAGQDLTEVTEAWLANARDVLTLFRRNRGRLLLVDARLLTSRSTEAERKALCSRLQVELPIVSTKNSDKPERQMALLLSSLVLLQIPALRKCLDELEASSFSVTSETFSIDDLTKAASLFKSISEQTMRMDDLREENALLKVQVGLQQEEIERLIEEQKLASLASEKSLARALADLRTEAKSRAMLQEERDSLLEDHQFASLASEKSLARALADLRTEAKSRARLQEERDSLFKKLDQVFASTSWRVTKPLRIIKLRILGGSPPADQAFAKTKP